ncbi:MAG: TonB-dependent receptor, partial [Acidobacteria bacterium]|nr:TonB-dependent receptor [Acidobacteriota bacterium]
EFFRNEALNANDFFRNLTGQKKPVLRQNQFGFTLGGPIKRDKLHFFGSYQGTRQSNGISGGCSSTVFLPPLTNDRSAQAIGKLFAGRRGFFQNLLGGVGPTVAADGSNIHPVALRLLQFKLPDGSFLIPNPQVVNSSQPLETQGVASFSIPCAYNENQFMVNLDFAHTAKSKFAGRVFSSDSDSKGAFLGGSVPTNVPGTPSIGEGEFRNVTLSHSYILSPNLFNEVRFGYKRTRSDGGGNAPLNYSDLGVSAPALNTIPAYFIGSVRFGSGGGLQWLQNDYVAQDSLSYVRGRHAMRFGGGISHLQWDSTRFIFPGVSLFQTWPDFLLGLDGVRNGTGLFSNLLGTFELLGQFDRAWRAWDGFLYAQDDFKVTSRFNLNLGVRYERIGHLSDSLGRNATFNASAGDPNPPASGSRTGYTVAANYSGGALPAGV